MDYKKKKKTRARVLAALRLDGWFKFRLGLG